ncbi:hypothetical protein D3C86_1303930 [compost metagenome]
MYVQWDKEWKTLAVENGHRPMDTSHKYIIIKQKDVMDAHLEVCAIKPKETEQ